MDFFKQGLEPLFFIVDPTKRLFFIYLLASFVLAFATLFLQGQSIKNILPMIFHPKVWGHRSSQLDVQLMFLNSFVKAGLFIVVIVSSLGLAHTVSGFLHDLFPVYKPLSWSYGTWVLLYSVLSFVLLDFSRFFQHYLFHKIPFLWQLHKVHHSAEVLTPMTLYRTHPLESIVSSLRRIVVIGVLSGVFVFMSRSMLGAYAILGVNAFDFFFNLFGSNLRHSHVWMSFGPLNRIFMSPAHHQIHHSRAERHFDKNLGFALSLWDQLFGTFYQFQSKEFIIFGVRGERHRGLTATLLSPFRSQAAEQSKKHSYSG